MPSEIESSPPTALAVDASSLPPASPKSSKLTQELVLLGCVGRHARYPSRETQVAGFKSLGNLGRCECDTSKLLSHQDIGLPETPTPHWSRQSIARWCEQFVMIRSRKLPSKPRTEVRCLSMAFLPPNSLLESMVFRHDQKHRARR